VLRIIDAEVMIGDGGFARRSGAVQLETQHSYQVVERLWLIELIVREGVEREVGNRRKEVNRGKDRKKGRSGGRKVFIACASLHWCIRIPSSPQSAGTSASSAAIPNENVSPKYVIK